MEWWEIGVLILFLTFFLIGVVIIIVIILRKGPESNDCRVNIDLCKSNQYCDGTTGSCLAKCTDNSQCVAPLVCNKVSGLCIPPPITAVTSDAYTFFDSVNEAFPTWTFVPNMYFLTEPCLNGGTGVIRVLPGNNKINIKFEFTQNSGNVPITIVNIQYVPNPSTSCSEYPTQLNDNNIANVILEGTTRQTFSQDFPVTTNQDFGILRVFFTEFSGSTFGPITVSAI